MNINSGIAFQILWIFYENAAKALNQQCISFSTPPTISFLRKSYVTKLRTLMLTFYLKGKCNKLKLFCMITKTITRSLTGLSLIQPSNTWYWLKDSNVHFLIEVFCNKGCIWNYFSWDYDICIIFFFSFDEIC